MQTLFFEIVGLTKRWKLDVNGEADFPKLLTNVTNVFNNRKKGKPTKDKTVFCKT